MIRPEILLYVLIMAGVTYLVRLIPILLVKKQIKNQLHIKLKSQGDSWTES